MKQLIFSFLFFCNMFLFSSIITAQEQKQFDSIKFYLELATNAKNKDDSKRSFNFFENQVDLHTKTKNDLGKVSILTSIAQIERNLGMISESEGTAIEAIEILDKIGYVKNYDDYKISLYNHLGILYKENGDFQTSLNYYNEILKLVKKPKDEVTVLNNLGNIYREKEDYKSAIELYQESYSKSIKVNDKKQISRVLNNLGQAQSFVGDTSAIYNLEKAIRIREEIDYKNGIISSLISLGEYYKKNGNTSKALSFSKRALSISNTYNKIPQKLATIELQCDLSYFNNFHEYKRLNDSMQKARNLSKHNYAALKYDKYKEIDRANKNELEKEKEKSTRIIYQTLGLIILTSSIFLYSLLKSKHKKDKIKEVYLKETQLSKKVHDELANDMSDLMNYVESEINVSNEKKTPLLNYLEDVYLRTRDISTETASIDLIHFSESLRNLLLQHNRQDTKVIINDTNTIDWLKVQDHVKMVVYRCLQELMVNMKKHSQAKLVSIVFKTQDAENIIHYTDDGIGASVSEIRSNGLQNVEYRINSIGGTFSFDTSKGNGFKAILMFKS